MLHRVSNEFSRVCGGSMRYKTIIFLLLLELVFLLLIVRESLDINRCAIVEKMDGVPRKFITDKNVTVNYYSKNNCQCLEELVTGKTYYCSRDIQCNRNDGTFSFSEYKVTIEYPMIEVGMIIIPIYGSIAVLLILKYL